MASSHPGAGSRLVIWRDIESQCALDSPDWYMWENRWRTLAEWLRYSPLDPAESQWLAAQVLGAELAGSLLKHVLKKEATEIHTTVIGVWTEFFLPVTGLSAPDLSLEQARTLKKYALFLVASAPSSRSRVSGLVLLESLLRRCHGPRWSDGLEVAAIVQKLLTLLSRGPSQTTSNLVKHLNLTLGSMCRFHADELVHFRDSLLHNLLEQLRRQTGSSVRSPDLTVIEGALLGLDDYLRAFPMSKLDQGEAYEGLYDSLRRVCPKGAEEKRWTARRAAVKLLGHHCRLFAEFITNEVEFWYETLHQWAFSRNRDDHRAGYTAFLAMLHVVGDCLADTPNNQATNYLLGKFRGILQQPDCSQGKATALAVQGYGYLAKACQKVMTDEAIHKMLFELIRRTEQVFFNDVRQPRELVERFTHIASYVEALANIVSATQTIPPASQVIFEKIVVYLIQHYPQIPKPYQGYAQVAVSKALTAVQSQNPGGDFLAEIVMKGMLESCSYPVMTEVEEGLVGGEPPVCVTSFQTLWTSIVANQESAIFEQMYRAFTENCLKVMVMLDLSLAKRDNNEETMDWDDESETNPKCIKDITVLANLVTLADLTLSSAPTEPFKVLCSTAIDQVLELSIRNPEISSLYRILTTFVGLGQKCGQLDLDSGINLKNSITKFAEDLFRRLDSYEEELLDACLGFAFVLPSSFVPSLGDTLQIPLILTFTVAKSDLGLMNKALAQCETWLEDVEPGIFRKIITPVVKHLNQLLTESHVESLEGNDEERQGKRRPVKVKKAVKSTLNLAQMNNDLNGLQMKILLFLGKLGTDTLTTLIPDKETLGEKVVKWSDAKALSFALPLPDCRLDMELDDLLPKISDLALNASSRKTRVAAAEALHTFSVYLIGKNATSTKDMKTSRPLTPIFVKILPLFVTLACDRDTVVRELFKPLLSQTIHWFTRNTSGEHPETLLLLDALMDGLTREGNSVVRRESAHHLNEFLKWSIKQTPKQEMLKRIHQPEALFQRLFIFWLHPDPKKRQGASIAFNCLYRTFREETVLAKEFSIDIVVHIMKSLSININSETGGSWDGSGLLEDASTALSHLVRIIKQKKKEWFSDDQNRRTPADLEGPNLDDLLVWLFSKAFETKEAARHKAIELIQAFAGDRATKENALEKALGGSTSSTTTAAALAKCLAIEALVPMDDDKLNVQSTIAWLDHLIRNVECYSWLIQINLVDESAAFLCPSLAASIDQCLQICLDLPMFKSKLQSASDYFGLENRLCFAIVQIFQLTRSFTKRVHVEVLWNKHFWEVVLKVCIVPSSLGFQVNRGSNDDLRQCLQGLLYFGKKLKLELPPDFPGIPDEFKPASICEIMANPNQPQQAMKNALGGYVILIEAGYVDFWRGQTLALVAKSLAGLNPCRQSARVLQILDFYLKIASAAELSDVLEDMVPHLTEYKVTRVWFKHLRKPHLERVFQRLLREFRDSQSILLHLILKLSQYLNRMNTSDRSIMMLELLGHVFAAWETLSKHSETSQDTLLSLIFILKQSLGASSTAKELAKSEKCRKFLENNLSSKSLDLKTKNLFLDFLLPFLDQGSVSLDASRVLEDFGNTSLPLASNELRRDSFDYQTYLETIQKLTSILIVTGSTHLLTFLIGILVREEHHIASNLIENEISTCLKELDSRKQEQLLLTAFKYINEDPSCPSGVKLRVLDIFLLPMIMGSKDVAVVRFSVDRVEGFLEKFFLPLTGTEDKRIEALVTKTASFKILGAIYGKLTQEKVHSTSSEIAKSALPFLKARKQVKDSTSVTGKELSIFLVRMLQAVKSEVMDGSAELKEYFRMYHCGAYNAMMSVISCVQTDEKFFRNYIFKENVSKSEMIWSRIVDGQREYNFPIEIEDLLSMKAQLVTVRRANRAGGNAFSGLSSMDSHYLADSSLSQTVTSYDFTQSSVVFNPNRSSKAENDTDASEANLITLENDDLNVHECMAPLVGTIGYLTSLKGNPDELPPDTDSPLPNWLETITDALSDTSQAKNSRGFLLKLIWNCRSLLETHRKALGRILLTVLAKDNLWSGDEKLNSLWLDSVNLLASWAHEVTPKDGEVHLQNCSTALISNLVTFSLTQENRQVVKHLLELIKTFVQCWHHSVRVCPDDLYSKFMSDPKKRPTVILILGIYFQHELDPVPGTALVSFKKFWDTVLVQIDHASKPQYVPAAQMIAMGLRFYRDKTSDPPFFDMVESKLESVGSSSASSTDKFLTCLFHCQMHVPEISHNFYRKYIYSLAKKSGEEIVFALKIVAACAPDLGKSPKDLAKEFSMIGIKKFLTHFDPPVQEASLRVLIGLLPYMEPSLLLEYLEHSQSMASHSFHQIRRSKLDLAQETYLRGSKTGLGTKVWKQIHQLAIAGITDALGDLHTNIVSQAVDFLDNHANLAGHETHARLATLFQDFATNGNQYNFLSTSVNLILLLCKRSPEMERKLFSDPLSDHVHFQDQIINTSWRYQTQDSKVPKFVETLSQSQTLEGHYIRATQQLMEFEMTQINESSIQGEGNPTNGAQSTNPHPQTGVDGAPLALGKKSSETLRPRRFQPSQNTDSDFERSKARFARIHSQSQAQEAKSVSDARGKRLAGVNLVRKYRVGELPDIQISSGDIVNAIGNLIKRDDELARMMMTKIIRGLLQDKSNATPPSFQDAIGKSLCSIIGALNMDDKQFAACLLELVAIFNPLDVNHNQISLISRALQLEPLGILALEKQSLHVTGHRVPSRKKSRRPDVFSQEDLNNYAQIMEMYKSLGYEEAVRGMAAQFLAEEEDFAQALNHESLSHFEPASELFQGLRSSSRQCDDAMKRLYDDFYLNSLERMSKWESVEVETLSMVDNKPDRLLDSDWSQNHLLPRFIRSSLFLSAEKTSSKVSSHLFKILDNQACRDELREKFGLDYAVAYLMKQNSVDAQMVIKQTLEKLVTDWGQMDIFSPQSILQATLKVRRLSQIQHFLSNPQAKFNCNPSSVDSLQHLDVLLRDQRVCLKFLVDSGTPKEESQTRMALNYSRACQEALERQKWMEAVRWLQLWKQMDSQGKYIQEIQMMISKVTVAKCLGATYKSLDDRINALYRSGVMGLEKTNSELNSEDFTISRIRMLQAMDNLFSELKDTTSIADIHAILSKPDKVDHFEKLVDKPKSLLDFRVKLMSGSIQEYSKIAGHSLERNMELANICHTLTKSFDVENLHSSVHRILLQSHLRAMKGGSIRAVQLFPNLLEHVEQHLDTSDLVIVFQEESAQIPSWKFLPWANQLVSFLGSAISHIVTPIVHKLAQDYPEAVRYPFRMFCDKQKFPEIHQLLTPSGVQDRILDGLSYLSSPYLPVVDFLSSALKNSDSQENRRRLADEIAELLTKVKADKGMFGRLYQRMESQCRTEILKDLEKSPKLSEVILKVKAKAKNASTILAEYVPFLASFHMSNHPDQGVEIPGQYLGYAEPNAQQKVKICYFDKAVHAFHSLRSPIKFTIVGDNGKRYDFIAKCGEDLRQDERIQQMFGLANDFFGQSNLAIHTYRVLPLSTKSGLIECVAHTKSFKSMAYKGGSLGVACSTQKDFLNMIRLDAPSRTSAFQESSKKLDNGVFKRSLEELSVSPEGFYFLRDNFIRSHATHSVVSWLLSIGDRHAENLLVSQITGESIPIDFGFAFGATAYLPIVELAPFRLTPQMQELIKPFFNHGPIREVMIQALSHVKENAGAFLSALRVFAREPTLDWLENAQRDALFSSGSATAKDAIQKFYPEKKMRIVENKLNGHHPSLVGALEAGQGRYRDPKQVKELKAVLLGDKTSRRHRLLCKDKLSSEEQVDCLLETATDPSILRCAFAGWAPYI